MLVERFACENADADASDIRIVVLTSVLSFMSFASERFSASGMLQGYGSENMFLSGYYNRPNVIRRQLLRPSAPRDCLAPVGSFRYSEVIGKQVKAERSKCL